MGATYYAMNKILDYVFAGGTLSQPPSFYVGLATATMTEASTSATEPAVGSYARISFAGNSTNWNTSTDGVLTNKLGIVFTEATADWGIITTVFVADALTGGNIWYYDNLADETIGVISVLDNMLVTIPAGALYIGLGTIVS